MTKTPTPWLIDIVKNPTRVTPVLKSQSSWNNNVTKVPTSYTPQTKNKDAWGHPVASQTYFYDDRFTYNDPLVSYNYLLNGNTSSQVGQTVWTQS